MPAAFRSMSVKPPMIPYTTVMPVRMFQLELVFTYVYMYLLTLH